jgi:hypothetical protein
LRSSHSYRPLRLPVILALFAPTLARANPRPLPFTYGYETLAEGEAEIEQYADFTPLKALSATTGAPAWYGATQFQTELEYGITDRLELGLYVTLAPKPGESFVGAASLTEGNGIKQRLRLRLAEEGEWPIDVALYGEVVENENEVELEAKVILQKRFGRLRLMTNLWAEREYYFANRRDWVINPTLGITYQVTAAIHPGLEYWMRAEFPDPAPSPRPFNVGPHHLAGPTMMVNFGKVWWSTGVYVRFDDFGRSLQPGDAFGPIWARTVVGVGF